MADYIDRERLKEAFNADLQTLQTVYEHTMNLILMDIDEAPAADVAPVVRCRECKHFNLETHECENELLSTDHEGGASYSLNFCDEDFCSYGERRAGGDNDA